MYLILTPEDKRIMHISTTIDYEPNGNFIIDTELRILSTIAECVEVDEIPEGVEPEKYLYVDGEFVENPNYREYRPEDDVPPYFHQHPMEDPTVVESVVDAEEVVEPTQEETL